MPYVSKKQQAYMNANKDKIGKKIVEEFNKASKKKKGGDTHEKQINR